MDAKTDMDANTHTQCQITMHVFDVNAHFTFHSKPSHAFPFRVKEGIFTHDHAKDNEATTDREERE